MAAGKRLTLEEVKNIFISEGYTPLFSEYKNAKTPLPFICDKGHHGTIRLDNFKSGKRCSKCRGGVRLNLHSVKEEFLKIGYQPLFDTYSNTQEPLPFKCDNGHQHKISLGNLKSGQRCGKCVGGVKVTIEEAQERFLQAGYTPLFLKYKNSHTKLPFKCGKGHYSEISLNSLTSGYRCKVCAGNQRLGLSQVKKVFLDIGYKPLFTEYYNNSSLLRFECNKGHTSYISLANLKNGKRCVKCFCSGFSREEKEIADHFSAAEIYFEENVRDIISPYELDLYFPRQKIAVEYCGLYWHSELSGGKDRKYHYNKRKLCEDQGIRLITVFSDEYRKRSEVVLSRIEVALGLVNKRVFARKCKVSFIPNYQSRSFLEKFHLQGSGRCKASFGLFLEDELLGVMTVGSLSRAHVDRGKTIELKRMCFVPGVLVVGGASKLFKQVIGYCRENEFNFVRSYQDMRYGNPKNSVYEKLGFYLISESKYTPHYVNNYTLRIRNQSLRKTPEERKTGKTEWELRQEQGYDRIWDCGHRTFEYQITD